MRISSDHPNYSRWLHWSRSKALHGALSAAFEQALMSCCFFHFTPAAKRKKPVGMRAGLWGELKSDLRAVAEASSQPEFISLVEQLDSSFSSVNGTRKARLKRLIFSTLWRVENDSIPIASVTGGLFVTMTAWAGERVTELRYSTDSSRRPFFALEGCELYCSLLTF